MTKADDAMQKAQFELSEGGSVVCVDFQSMAGLVDAVAGADPVRLTTLFNVIWETHYKLETRSVLTAAITCRDPLAGLDTFCKDALQTLSDLEMLASTKHAWSLPRDMVTHSDPRANALLNACDDKIARLSEDKAKSFVAIRERLVDAAAAERTHRDREIRVRAALLQNRCSNLWSQLEFWRDKE